jgi:hypothetical protein
MSFFLIDASIAVSLRQKISFAKIYIVQEPDTLTTSGRFNYNYHKYFNNKHLIPAKNSQSTAAKSG